MGYYTPGGPIEIYLIDRSYLIPITISNSVCMCMEHTFQERMWEDGTYLNFQLVKLKHVLHTCGLGCSNFICTSVLPKLCMELGRTIDSGYVHLLYVSNFWSWKPIQDHNYKIYAHK